MSSASSSLSLGRRSFIDAQELDLLPSKTRRSPFTDTVLHTLQWIAVTAPMLWASTVQAQTVYKCSVNGQTVYQQRACSDGRLMPQAAAPSASEAEAARLRAQALKARAEAIPTVSAPARSTNTGAGPLRRGASDCTTLDRQLGEAWGRRNGSLHQEGGPSASKDAYAYQKYAEVEAAQRRSAAAGCSIK
jgi:hypothetical protein